MCVTKEGKAQKAEVEAIEKTGKMVLFEDQLWEARIIGEACDTSSRLARYFLLDARIVCNASCTRYSNTQHALDCWSVCALNPQKAQALRDLALGACLL
jgi:hypothetical protein